MSKELKRVGLKVTPPRLKILQIFEKSINSHLSAEDIYKTLLEMNEDVGLATVYRVLAQFEAAQLIIRHNFEGGHAVFELRHEEHHDHLVCLKCGKVEEFFDNIIEERQQLVAGKSNFKMTNHVLNIYGLCSVCQI